MIILEEHFRWHLEAFASEVFIYTHIFIIYLNKSSELYCQRTFSIKITVGKSRV